MKNTQNFEIRVCQEEPSMFAPQWTREFEFIFETEENGIEKRYRGYYWWNSEGEEGVNWWNSEGEEGVKWDEFEEKPNFGEHEAEMIKQIKSEVVELIMELEKEKEDYWMLPRMKIKLFRKS
jgi:hypothetical protein